MDREKLKRKELSSIHFLIPTRATVDNSPMNKPVIAEHSHARGRSQTIRVEQLPLEQCEAEAVAGNQNKTFESRRRWFRVFCQLKSMGR